MRKLWVVAPLVAVLFIATPASAVDFNFHHKFKDKAKQSLGCMLTIDSIKKNYSPTVHYLRVSGNVRCKKSVNIDRVVITFSAHATQDRHVTQYTLTDSGSRFDLNFALDAQCNRKWGDVWNHPFQPVSLSEVAVTYAGHDYRAKGYQKLPYQC